MEGALENKSAVDVAGQTGPNSTLTYSSPPKRRLRRVLLRRVMPLLMVFLIGWAAFANRSELAFRAQRIYWGWRCMRHVTPAGTVLLESDPQKAADLLKHNRDYVQNGMQWSGMYLGMVNKFSMIPAVQAAYWPQDFRRYFVLTDQGPEHGLKEAIAFMGERRSADGHHRLVVIPYGEVETCADPGFELGNSFVLPLPGWFGSFEPLRSPHRLLQYSDTVTSRCACARHRRHRRRFAHFHRIRSRPDGA